MAETREQIRKSIQGSRGLFVCSFPDNEACADAKRQLAEKDKRIGDLVGKVHQIDAIWAVQVNALSRGNNELKRDNASLLAIIKKHEDWIDQHGKTQWGIVERLEKENASLKAENDKLRARVTHNYNEAMKAIKDALTYMAEVDKLRKELGYGQTARGK